MSKNLTGKKLGIIHAALITTRAVQKYLDEIIPEVEVVHFVDDTIQNTNFACAPGVIPPGMVPVAPASRSGIRVIPSVPSNTPP